MERDFWLERWDNQQIGFHQPGGQPLLAEFWPTLALPQNTDVLVPLCGKTADMAWLAAAGHRVTGVEFSERAAGDFFTEHKRTPRHDMVDEFIRYRDDTIEIRVGDFFALGPAFIGAFDAVYDRAALIALPPDLRARYVEHLLAGLKPGAIILLIAIDYDQNEMAGPPFAVSEADVHALYGDGCEIAKLFEQDTLSVDTHLAARGLSRATEEVYCLTRR